MVTAACTGSDVQAPATTVVEDALRPVVLPEIVAAPEVEPEPTDSEPAPDTDPATFYVSPLVGDDASDGQTPEAPWASLGAALDRLEPGHTLYLMTGEYDENAEPGNAHYTIDVGGTPEAWIRVTAAPDAEPVIVANQGNAIVVRADYVEISGLDIQGRGFNVDNPYGWGVLVRESHHVRVVGNRVSGMAVGGITSVESTHMEFLYNEVFENSFWGTEQGSGIATWRSMDQGLPPGEDGYHDRIVGNIIYRNENKVLSRWHDDKDTITDGNGIIVDTSDETGYLGRVLVADNVIFDNGGRAVLVLDASQVDIMHNTTYHNGRTAILEGGPVEIAAGRARDVRVLNNLIWAAPGNPGVIVEESAEVEMAGNLIVSDVGRGPATGLDLVVLGDPGLRFPSIDPAVADFRPLEDSLARGRAIPTDPALEVDVDGNPRPFSGATAGAYEWRP